MEAFDQCDHDGDDALSISEFMAYRARRQGLRLPASNELADVDTGM
jgi:hypothetical protein